MEIPKQVQIVGMSWYRREDYARILEVMEDAHVLHATHAEWLAAAEKTQKGIEAKGYRAFKAELRLDEFVAWCRNRGLNINADARKLWGNEAAYNVLRGQSTH